MQRGFFIQAIGVVALVFAGLGALFLNGAKGAFVWIHLLAATLLFLVGTLQSKRAVRSAAGGAAAGLQISHGIWMKILTALLFAAVLVAVNLVAIRFDARWDLTESNVHTLSKESVEITELISQLRLETLFSPFTLAKWSLPAPLEALARQLSLSIKTALQVTTRTSHGLRPAWGRCFAREILLARWEIAVSQPVLICTLKYAGMGRHWIRPGFFPGLTPGRLARERSDVAKRSF